MAMNFITQDYSQLKTEKLGNILKHFLTSQLKYQNYDFLKKRFTKR